MCVCVCVRESVYGVQSMHSRIRSRTSTPCTIHMFHLPHTHTVQHKPYTHTHSHTLTHSHTHTLTHSHTHTHTHSHTLTHTHSHTHTLTHSHTQNEMMHFQKFTEEVAREALNFWTQDIIHSSTHDALFTQKTHGNVSACVCMCVCVYVCECMYVCVCVCMAT
jgi:hypothetical protein